MWYSCETLYHWLPQYEECTKFFRNFSRENIFGREFVNFSSHFIEMISTQKFAWRINIIWWTSRMFLEIFRDNFLSDKTLTIWINVLQTTLGYTLLIFEEWTRSFSLVSIGSLVCVSTWLTIIYDWLSQYEERGIFFQDFFETIFFFWVKSPNSPELFPI